MARVWKNQFGRTSIQIAGEQPIYVSIDRKKIYIGNVEHDFNAPEVQAQREMFFSATKPALETVNLMNERMRSAGGLPSQASSLPFLLSFLETRREQGREAITISYDENGVEKRPLVDVGSNGRVEISFLGDEPSLSFSLDGKIYQEGNPLPLPQDDPRTSLGLIERASETAMRELEFVENPQPHVGPRPADDYPAPSRRETPPPKGISSPPHPAAPRVAQHPRIGSTVPPSAALDPEIAAMQTEFRKLLGSAHRSEMFFTYEGRGCNASFRGKKRDLVELEYVKNGVHKMAVFSERGSFTAHLLPHLEREYNKEEYKAVLRAALDDARKKYRSP